MQHELFLVGPHLTYSFSPSLLSLFSLSPSHNPFPFSFSSELVRFALTVSNNKENPRSLRQRVLGFVEVAATYRPVQLLQTNLLGLFLFLFLFYYFL